MHLVGIDPGKKNLGICVVECDVLPLHESPEEWNYHVPLDEKTQLVFNNPSVWKRINIGALSCKGAEIAMCTGTLIQKQLMEYFKDCDLVAIEQQVMSKFGGGSFKGNVEMRDMARSFQAVLAYEGIGDKIIEVNSRSILTINRKIIDHDESVKHSNYPIENKKTYKYAEKKRLSIHLIKHILEEFKQTDHEFMTAEKEKQDDMADSFWLAMIQCSRIKQPDARKRETAYWQKKKREEKAELKRIQKLNKKNTSSKVKKVKITKTSTMKNMVIKRSTTYSNINTNDITNIEDTAVVAQKRPRELEMESELTLEKEDKEDEEDEEKEKDDSEHNRSKKPRLDITKNSKPWVCYGLISKTGKSTYIGATVDPERRLRQHNGELVGGAKATRRGRPWTRKILISGFLRENDALSFEKNWQFRAKNRRGYKLDSVTRLYNAAMLVKDKFDKESQEAGLERVIVVNKV